MCSIWINKLYYYLLAFKHISVRTIDRTPPTHSNNDILQILPWLLKFQTTKLSSIVRCNMLCVVVVVVPNYPDADLEIFDAISNDSALTFEALRCTFCPFASPLQPPAVKQQPSCSIHLTRFVK
jgi:hypothetical protein